MHGIFDLKTDVSELSSANQGISRSQINQISATRDITGSNWSNGSIYYNFQTSSTRWFMPSKSFLRMRCSLTRGDMSQLLTSDGVAMNMGLCANLYQSLEFRINDKVVSRISDFVPQVDAISTRMSKSKSWLDSIGSINFWNADFTERLTDVSFDGSLADTYESVLSRTELGYDAATNRLAIAEDTGLLTFTQNGGQALPANNMIWFPGDYIDIDSGDAETGVLRYRISAVAGATTLALDGLKTNALAAGAYEFTRVRTLYSNDDARKKMYFELMWQPPLSIFNVEHCIPSGNFSLVMNPSTSSSYQKMAVETKLGGGDINPGLTASSYKFDVIDQYFFVQTYEGPRADNLTYLLDLTQVRVQSDKIDSVSFSQKSFDVSPSTYQLSVCFQDLRAGNNSQISQSKFKSYNAGVNAATETALTRFYLNFAGQSQPNPDFAGEFNSTTDYLTQRYLETQLNTGAFFDTGGPESYADWIKRGMYMTFQTPRDGSDRSTRVMLNQQFATGTDVTNLRVLLFDHSKQVCRVRVQDGQVVQVDLEDV